MNVTKIARINVDNKEEYQKIKKEIMEDIKENNIKAFRWEEGFTTPDWGSYCMYGLPYEKAVEYAEKYELSIDMIKPILQNSDIDSVQVGDKVQYKTDSIFGLILNKGTIYAKTENTVIIRLYRSKTKGHTLKAGQIGLIRKGWDTCKELEAI